MGKGHKSSVLHLCGHTVKKPGAEVRWWSLSLAICTLRIIGWTVSRDGQVLEHSTFGTFLCKSLSVLDINNEITLTDA